MWQPLTEPLASRHDRAGFSSGQPQLDRYLQQQASQDVRRKVAAVFVACERDSTRVAAYYTLSAYALLPREVPGALLARLPRYDRLPALLLGRLALDQRFQGQGLGGKLLLDALFRGFQQTQHLGAVAFVVDAIDDTAASFYQHFGFQPLQDHPNRLFLPMATIARLWAEQTGQ